MECGPPSFSKLNFFLSTRMCVQSSVSAEANVEKRSGTAIESAFGRMMALGGGGERKRDLGRMARERGDSENKSTKVNERQGIRCTKGGRWYFVGAIKELVEFDRNGRLLGRLNLEAWERFRVNAKQEHQA
jgi:hypothetical protein